MSDREHSPNDQGFASAGASRDGAPAEGDLVDLLNQPPVCASDAGPAWKAAFAAGVDMSLVEDALKMTPQVRLREHQRSLDQILALRPPRPSHDPGN